MIDVNLMGEWQNFYVVVASAAAGLTGLQFVVMALIADIPLARNDLQAGEAFASPTIVHFGMVLLLAAVLVMPWHGAQEASLIWGIIGLVGIVFTLVVARRMRGQKGYKPVFEDWLFRVLTPLTGYCLLAAAAGVARVSVRASLFVVAAVMLLLLFIGIHNAWDNVTYLVFVKKRELQ